MCENGSKKINNKNNLVSSLIGISVSAFSIFILILLNKNFAKNFNKIIFLDFRSILLSISLFLLSIFIYGLRIRYLSKYISNKNIKISRSFIIAAMSSYISAITPSSLGGQPYQIYELSKEGLTVAEASSVTVTIMFSNAMAFFLISIVFLHFIITNFTMKYMIYIIPISYGLFFLYMFLIFLSLFFHSFLKKVISKIFSTKIYNFILKILKKSPDTVNNNIYKNIDKFYEINVKNFKDPIFYLKDIIFSVFYYSAYYIIPYIFYLQIVSYKIVNPFFIAYFFSAQILISITIFFIPTPGSSGGFEAMAFYLFTFFLPESYIPNIILGWRFITYYILVMFGAVYSISKIFLSKNKKHI